MSFSLEARRRTTGTGEARRLRRQGQVPGIVYGGGEDNAPIALDGRTLSRLLGQEAFHAQVVELLLEGKKEEVILRDYALHPVDERVLHVDFQRIKAQEAIEMEVPLHFAGEAEAPGVKVGGGMVNHILTAVAIICLPRDLPEAIAVDLSRLEIGETLHLSNLTPPAGVAFAALKRGEDLAVATIVPPAGGERASTEETA